MNFSKLLIAGLLALTPTTGMAATYTFSMIYDGSSIDYAPGSQMAGGTTLNIGDMFNLLISAAPGGFWTVDGDVVNAFLMGGFFVDEVSGRTGDILTQFSYMGGTVLETSETGVAQELVHVGSQSTSIADGAVFDQFLVQYTLQGYYEAFDKNANANVIATSTTLSEGLAFGGFADSSLGYSDQFVYSSAVPLPATLPMMVGALAVFGAVARRRLKRS